MTSASATVAPCSVVIVRDEEWLVTSTETTDGLTLLSVHGLSELVSGTNATFYDSLDEVEVADPTTARWWPTTHPPTADPGCGSRRQPARPRFPSPTAALGSRRRHWLPRWPISKPPYGRRSTRTTFARASCWPTPSAWARRWRSGIILAELARRGRADRSLVVSPRHVLEQMQHELWTRFALPFVRLDSVGVQRVKQVLPATRNPFTCFKRVIISIDTLKQGRFAHDLRRHRWDAVVIDESHNITNSSTQNNQLARVLAPNTDALILASATPHNGRQEPFAELVRLLEPTAVTPEGELIGEEVKRLVVRRHRNSPEVAQAVGSNWAERREPLHLLVEPSPAEDAVARELDEVWLHPQGGGTLTSGAGGPLFPWTLAKAFLSSPAALAQTIRERLRRGDRPPKASGGAAAIDTGETAALQRLADLNEACLGAPGGKYGQLVEHLRDLGIGRASTQRVVIFAERVATLSWLQRRLPSDLRLPPDAVTVLHGGLDDQTQQDVVENPDIDQIALAVYRMDASQLQVAKPILMWLHEPDQPKPAGEIRTAVAAVESWLMRRMVMRLPTSDLGRVVANLITSFRTSDPVGLGQRIHDQLAREGTTSAYWPGDADLRAALAEVPAYRAYPRTRLRMMLEAVEDAQRGYVAGGRARAGSRIPRNQMHIEHLLPQSWKRHWPVSDLAEEIARNEHVHRLGNLTLLTQTLNSEVSNGPWSGAAGKQAALEKHDVSLMTRSVRQQHVDSWDERDIDARTQQMIDNLLATWPVPDGHVGHVDQPVVTDVNVTAGQLVAAGLLVPGTELLARDSGLPRAIVTSEGCFDVAGQVFTTPSGAGQAILGRAVNGWYFWRLPDGRRLKDLRDDYLRTTTAGASGRTGEGQ